MELNITTKWILGIVATIFLGALGSGLWSLIFDPLVKKFGKFLMSVSSLGIRSIQNRIYAEVAKGHRDRSVEILMFIIATAIIVPTVIPFAIESKYKRYDEELKEAVAIVKSQFPNEDKLDEKISVELERIRNERRSSAKFTLVAMTSVLLLIVFFQYIRIMLIDSLISNFERCVNICLPYLEGNEHKVLLSKFALIQTKSDYSAIMENMETIAKRVDLELPI